MSCLKDGFCSTLSNELPPLPKCVRWYKASQKEEKPRRTLHRTLGMCEEGIRKVNS